jgi:hypothetical protein
MSSIILVHPKENCEVVGLNAILKCNLFQNNITFAAVPYKIRSSVPLDIFRQFVAVLNGNPVTITEANLTGLLLLSEEFGFEALGTQLSEFRQSTMSKGMEDTEARARIAAKDERIQQRDHDSEALQSARERITALEEQVRQRDHDSEALQSAREQIATLEERIQQRDRDMKVLRSALARFTENQECNSLNSVIISGFPNIFELFKGKHFQIL